jgi:hypothetical protein
MRVFGDMSLAGLATLVHGGTPEGSALGLTARVLDTDGDGRSDLFLVDDDSDGTVDGIVRGLDVNGDGLNDTYLTYNDDGSVRSIGRVNEAGELEVVYEEPGLFEQLLADLGLTDLQSPEDALFTSFDDPYIADTYGTWAEDLPDDLPETIVVQPSDVIEMSESEYLDLSGGVSVVGEDADGNEAEGARDHEGVATETSAEAGAEKGAETTAAAGQDADGSDGSAGSQADEQADSKILEVGDAGDGWLYARVDTDGDGVADRKDDLQRTVGGWEADVDKDGLKETVAFDVDEDGRVDSVDTSGTGDWAGSTRAWEVVHQPSDLVDDGVFEGDAGPAAIDDTADTGSVDAGGTVDAALDSDADMSGDAGAGTDAADSYDTGSSADTGGSGDAGSADPGPVDDSV